MIYYRLYKNNNEKSDNFGKIYGKATISGYISTEQLAEMITDRCTVTDTDTLAVLHALAKVMKKELQDGKSTKPADDEKSFNVSENLKGIHIIFQPESQKASPTSNKRVKTLLAGAQVTELPTDVSDRKKTEEATTGNGNETQNP